MKTAVEIAKHFEGLRLAPYKCPAGVWTIGYGTTRYPGGLRVKPTDGPCTVVQAEHWLEDEMDHCRGQVISIIGPQLNEHQIEALTDFVYNLGAGAFRASTLRRRINDGDFADVPYQLSRWVRGGGRVLPGLIRRREAEIKLFTLGV